MFRQAVRVEGGHVQHRRVDEEQRHPLVRRLGHALQGLGPGIFIDDDRQHLSREKRPVVHRDDVELVRLLLVRQHEAVGDDFLILIDVVVHAAPVANTCSLDG